MKLIKLNSTDNNGQVSPVLINTATIEMVQPDEVGNSQIFFVGRKLDVCITVIESVDEIGALSNGQVTQEFLPVTVDQAKVSLTLPDISETERGDILELLVDTSLGGQYFPKKSNFKVAGTWRCKEDIKRLRVCLCIGDIEVSKEYSTTCDPNLWKVVKASDELPW